MERQCSQREHQMTSTSPSCCVQGRCHGVESAESAQRPRHSDSRLDASGSQPVVEEETPLSGGDEPCLNQLAHRKDPLLPSVPLSGRLLLLVPVAVNSAEWPLRTIIQALREGRRGQVGMKWQSPAQSEVPFGRKCAERVQRRRKRGRGGAGHTPGGRSLDSARHGQHGGLHRGSPCECRLPRVRNQAGRARQGSNKQRPAHEPSPPRRPAPKSSSPKSSSSSEGVR